MQAPVLVMLALSVLGLLALCSMPRPAPPQSGASPGTDRFDSSSRGRMPRVAYVWTGPPAPGVATFFEVFTSSLQAYGWVDGQTVTVESVSADNQPERY